MLKLALFCCCLIACCAWVYAQPPAKQPNLKLLEIKGAKPRNVVFILTDDHRFDFMGFTGKLPRGVERSSLRASSTPTTGRVGS